MTETFKKYFLILLGPLLACLVWTFFDNYVDDKAELMAGVAVWLATWWFTEAVHLGVASLVPILLMPLLGIVEIKTVAQQYTDSIIFLFLGGFMMAFAIEKWNLHKRIALTILSITGGSLPRILAGVMIATYLISNWISNTATTMMLFGAVTALIAEIESLEEFTGIKHRISAALLLGLGYSATIGGMATPVGTPPNMFFFKAYHNAFPERNDLNFISWSSIGYPISITLLLVCFAILYFYYIRNHGVKKELSRGYFVDLKTELGPMQYEEKVVFSLFILMALMWLTRADIVIGSFQFHGWAGILPQGKMIDDASVAVFIALLLFIIPSKKNKNESILEWEDAKKIRYDIILMFGSGFALAYGIEKSGLSDWLAASLNFLKGAHPLLIILGICSIITLISEFASNLASIQLAIPIMISIQKEFHMNPLFLMIPATFAASLGFMLPVATAANTIVFGTKKIQIHYMFRIGFLLDIIGIIIICIFSYFYYDIS